MGKEAGDEVQEFDIAPKSMSADTGLGDLGFE